MTSVSGNSVHTTKQSSWCRLCEAFLPPSMTYEEHDAKIHGITPKKGKVKTPSAKEKKARSVPSSQTPRNEVEDKAQSVSSKKGNKTPSRAAKKKLSQASPQKPDAALKMIKKPTPAKPSVVFVCKICSRAFSTNVARAKHMRSHTLNVEESPTPPFLHCYECNTKVEKEIYITHLMFHDAERKNGEENSGKQSEPEQIERKYLYLKPDDPRKTAPNAILQCPACPTFLFFSSKTYEIHLNECKKIHFATMTLIKSEPIDMDE